MVIRAHFLDGMPIPICWQSFTQSIACPWKNLCALGSSCDAQFNNAWWLISLVNPDGAHITFRNIKILICHRFNDLDDARWVIDRTWFRLLAIKKRMTGAANMWTHCQHSESGLRAQGYSELGLYASHTTNKSAVTAAAHGCYLKSTTNSFP